MIINPFFWAVIMLIGAIIVWISLKTLLDISSLRRTLNKKYYSILTIIVILQVIANIFNIDPTIKVIVSISMSYCFYKINYQVSWVKSAVILGVFWGLLLTSESIVMIAITKIYRLESHMTLLEPSYIRLLFIISTNVLLMTIIIAYKKLKIVIDNEQNELFYIILPLITNSIILIFIFWIPPIAGVNIQKYYSVILSITLFVILANMSLIVLIRKITKRYEKELEYKSYQDKMKTEYNYYIQMEAEHEMVRRLYHDINNHIACIKGLIENPERLKKYIQTLEGEVPPMKQVFDTGNTVVDTLLRQKSILCDRSNIELQSMIDLEKIEFIEDRDFCSIFGNALDNAIEACEKIDNRDSHRYIWVETNYVKNFFIMKVKNSKSNSIKRNGNQYITNKKDKLLHGLGLKNIQDSVKKYNGEMIVEYTENEFYLKVVIPLNCN